MQSMELLQPQMVTIVPVSRLITEQLSLPIYVSMPHRIRLESYL
jgi:hypothetical protein